MVGRVPSLTAPCDAVWHEDRLCVRQARCRDTYCLVERRWRFSNTTHPGTKARHHTSIRAPRRPLPAKIRVNVCARLCTCVYACELRVQGCKTLVIDFLISVITQRSLSLSAHSTARRGDRNTHALSSGSEIDPLCS